MYSVTCHLIGTTPENPASGWNVTCNTFRSFRNGRLFKRNAQRLGGKRSRGTFIFFSFSMKLQRFFTRCFLYPLFPVGMLSTAPRSQNQIVLFEIGDKVFPFRHLYQVLIHCNEERYEPAFVLHHGDQPQYESAHPFAPNDCTSIQDCTLFDRQTWLESTHVVRSSNLARIYSCVYSREKVSQNQATSAQSNSEMYSLTPAALRSSKMASQ